MTQRNKRGLPRAPREGAGGGSGRRIPLRLLALLAVAAMLPVAHGAGTHPLCAGCHSEDGNSIIPENPKLAGFDSEYIMKQLSDFKSGKRASPVMSAMIGQISEGDFDALASYYSEQKRTPGVVGNPALAAQGKVIYEEGIVAGAVPACSGCHNEDGSGTAKFPRLAGQHPAYVVQQMTNFKNGSRNNDSREVMRAVAKRMNDREIRAVAEYVAGLKGE